MGGMRTDSLARGAWALGAAALWLYVVDRATSWWFDGGLDIAGAAGEALVLAAHAGATALVALIALAAFAVGGARHARRWASALVWAVAFAAGGIWLGASLGRGAWLARQAFAWAVPWGAGLAGAGAGALLGVVVARDATRGAWRTSLAWVGLSLAASVGDALVWPGLYPDVHLALYFGSATCAFFAARAAFAAWQPPTAARVLASLVVVACLGGVFAWWFASGSPRGAALSASASASNLVTRVLRPPSGRWLRQELARRVPARPSRPGSTTSFFAPRADTNVILVIVDTLRGDALPPMRTGKQAFAREGDTPFLDRWLAGSYRFRRVYAQATRTQFSMPPLFQSAEPFEDTDRAGLPLPTLLARLGRVPVAVVPQYFLMPFEASSRRLLDGFARVGFYEKDRQSEMLSEVRTTLGGVRHRPFFAWVHFYNQHQPYYAGHPTSGRDGSLPERYRLALRWLDQQMRAFVALLDELGIADRTLVVFAADHGENLGDRRHTGHGGTVRDSEARVPLALHIPGKPGGVVDTTVGNIDIVPTIVELLGGQPLPEHRGQSLVPLLANPRAARDSAYYVRNGSGKLHALVYAGQKLVFSEATGLFTRHDLTRDPAERRNAFRETSALDADLVARMVRKNPALAQAELGEPETRALLVKRLDTAPGDSLDPDTVFVLRAASLAPVSEVQAAAERLFARARSADVRIAIAEGMGPTDAPRWDTLLAAYVTSIRDPALLHDVVATLARRGHGPIAVAWVQRRLRAVAAKDASEWEPWLRLVRPWPKRGRAWVAAFERLLRAAQERTAGERETPVAVLSLLLDDVATLGGGARSLADHVRPHVEHVDASVSAGACAALGRFGDAEDAALLRKRATQAGVDPRVRQAILQALARLEGAASVDVVIALGRDPLLTVDAVQVLGTLKSKKGLPFLRDVARHHYNAYTRSEARKAIARVSRRATKR